MHPVIPIVSTERNCDGCTVCCDGWLAGKVNEHYFYPGQKCHYVSDIGCTIYEDRPYIPCKKYKCGWLVDKEIPEWMKPSNIQAVINVKDDNSLIMQRNKVTLLVVSWIKKLYIQGKIKINQPEENFLLEMNKSINKYGKYLMLLDIKRLGSDDPVTINILKKTIDTDQDEIIKMINSLSKVED